MDQSHGVRSSHSLGALRDRESLAMQTKEKGSQSQEQVGADAHYTYLHCSHSNAFIKGDVTSSTASDLDPHPRARPVERERERSGPPGGENGGEPRESGQRGGGWR